MDPDRSPDRTSRASVGGAQRRLVIDHSPSLVRLEAQLATEQNAKTQAEQLLQEQTKLCERLQVRLVSQTLST